MNGRSGRADAAEPGVKAIPVERAVPVAIGDPQAGRIIALIGLDPTSVYLR